MSKCRSTAQIEPCDSQTFNDFFFCNEPHKYFASVCPYNMMCHARNCFCVAKGKNSFCYYFTMLERNWIIMFYVMFYVMFDVISNFYLKIFIFTKN